MKPSSLCLALSFLLLPLSQVSGEVNESRPNIILIMADDMGYEALSANGSESSKSPHHDKLAATGVRFTN